jgi:hypothetical protein
MTRKEFLELVGRSALFAATAPGLEAAAAQSADRGLRPALTPARRATLEALAGEIIPAADGIWERRQDWI